MRLLHHQIVASASQMERSLKFQLPELPPASLYLAFIATSGGKAPGLAWSEHWFPVVEFASEATHTFMGLYRSQTGLGAVWTASKPIMSILGCVQVFEGAQVREVYTNPLSGVVTPPLRNQGPACHFCLQDWQGNTILPPEYGHGGPVPAEFFEFMSSNDTTGAHCYTPDLRSESQAIFNSYPGNSYGGCISVGLGEIAAPAPSVDLKALAAQMREWADKLEAAK